MASVSRTYLGSELDSLRKQRPDVDVASLEQLRFRIEDGAL
jgi:hypothetical protein